MMIQFVCVENVIARSRVLSSVLSSVRSNRTVTLFFFTAPTTTRPSIFLRHDPNLICAIVLTIIIIISLILIIIILINMTGIQINKNGKQKKKKKKKKAAASRWVPLSECPVEKNAHAQTSRKKQKKSKTSSRFQTNEKACILPFQT